MGAATALGAPGVKRTGRMPLVVRKVLPGVVRIHKTLPLVLGRNQKLRVQTVLVSSGGMDCRMADAALPLPVAMRWRLLLPEWLNSVLTTELLWLPKTVQGPLSALSKSPFAIKFGPTPACVPLTRTRSSR